MPLTVSEFLNKGPKTTKGGLVSVSDTKGKKTPPKKGLISVEEFAKNLPSKGPSYGERLLAPTKELGKLYGGGQEGIASKLKEDISAGIEDIKKGDINKGVVKTQFRLAGDVAGLIFAPIGTIINTALAAVGIDKGFEKAGEISQTPSKFNPINRLTDIPAVQKWALAHPNAGADFERALNLILSKSETGKIEPKTVVERTIKQIFPDTPPQIKKLIIDSQTEDIKIKVNTPRSRQQEYAESQGYEPITPEGKLPSIEFGERAPAQDNLPVIQTEPVVEPSLPKGLRYEPVTQEPVARPITVQEFVSKPKEVKSEFKEPESKPLLSTEDTGKAVEILEKDSPPRTDFERQTNPVQIEQISKMDMGHVTDVAMGRARPDGNLPATAYRSVAALYADKVGDVALQLELSKSNVKRVAGQELQATQIAGKETVADILSDIRIKLEDQIPQAQKLKRAKEMSVLETNLRKTLAETKPGKPTKAKLLKLLGSIKCK